MTHRQYLVWTEWLEEEWDTPSRTDWYLMQLAARVLQSQAKSPNRIKTEKQRIEFVQEYLDGKGVRRVKRKRKDKLAAAGQPGAALSAAQQDLAMVAGATKKGKVVRPPRPASPGQRQPPQPGGHVVPAHPGLRRSRGLQPPPQPPQLPPGV